eukprot:12452113-Prorocentrum_lima.AAC.1
MTSSLVGSEMCIRDSKMVEGADVVWCGMVWSGVVSALATSILSYQEAVSYTHLTLPTICSV